MPLYLRYFIGIWTAFIGACLLIPLEPTTSQLPQALRMCAGFAILTSAAALATTSALERILPLPGQGQTALPVSILRTLMGASILMSFVGLGFQLFDKVALQEIDFSSGIAAAREQWRRAGEAREGVSSAFSALGYVFATSSFVAVGLLVLNWELISSWLRAVVAAAALAGVLIASLLAGGRSSLLLFVVFVLAFYTLRREQGKSPLRISLGVVLALALAAALFVGFAIYVFSERAATSGEVSLDYVEGMLVFLGTEPPQWLSRLDPASPFSALIGFTLLVVTYLLHSAFTFGSIIQFSDGRGTIIFGHVMQMAAKLGMIDAIDTDWFLSGLFPSLPGSLFHQYGESGMLVGALILGMASALARKLSLDRPRSLLSLGIAASAYVTMYLSPLILAADLLSFPFIVIEFGVLGALAGALSIVARSRQAAEPADLSAAQDGSQG